MTTIHVPYVCGKCNNQFDVVMKIGEPIIPRTCPKCDNMVNGPTL